MDEKRIYETEIDFKNLPKSPSRLFGWIFPYYLILFLIVGIFFVKHMDFASMNNIAANYTDSLVVNANVEVKKGGIMPAIDLGIISSPSKELIENGKVLYNTNCASCHGEDGKGNGVAAAALNPPPRNFYDPEEWKNGREFNSMYTTLQKGIAGGGMIAYEFLPIEDRIAMIHYIRSMSDFPPITEEIVKNIDETYELSKGVNTPNNITLEMATEKIVNESGELTSNVNVILENLKNFSNDDAVKLFNEYTVDRERALSIFKRDFRQGSNSNEFILRVTNSPSEIGFKSSASLLSKKDLNTIFDLLKKSIG